MYPLSQVYLDWVEANRAVATYSHNLHYLKSFIDHVGRTLKIGALRKHHLTKWIAANPNWESTTTQNDAITIVQRMLNWAVEEGLIIRSPIPKVKKPKRRNREVFYTEEQWRSICAEIKGCFLDLMTFIWETGCRPQEARVLRLAMYTLIMTCACSPNPSPKGKINSA